MRRVRSVGTTPEVELRKALWAQGLRYRISPSSLPGKPDIVLPKFKLAIFVDGDFWHGGQWKKRNLRQLEDQFRFTANRDYWLQKIRRNMHRDCITTAQLQGQGWVVLRFWESEIRTDLEGCVRTTLRTANGDHQDREATPLAAKTFADFFAGIGLVRMGLESHGWSCKFANDIDPNKREMHSGHFGDDGTYLLGDIHHLKGKQVPTVTLATASFPCNDLSVAGSRSGLEGKDSSAYWGFIRVLDEMGGRRPPVVLVENVPGFLTCRGGEDFRVALLGLNELGYSVDSFFVDALQFVPQSRERLFVVGVKQPTSAEKRGFYESPLRPKPLAEFILTHPEIEWSVRELPIPAHSDRVIDSVIEDVPEDSDLWWSLARSEYLLNQMSDKHREIADLLINEERWSYGTVFRRIRQRGGVKRSMAELRTDGIAGCLRTPRGGSGRQILVMAGFGLFKVRLLTPVECARLMGTGQYNISVGQNQALFGFGDAVCVPVIEWVAQNYLNPLVSELMRSRPMYFHG